MLRYTRTAVWLRSTPPSLAELLTILWAGLSIFRTWAAQRHAHHLLTGTVTAGVFTEPLSPRLFALGDLLREALTLIAYALSRKTLEDFASLFDALLKILRRLTMRERGSMTNASDKEAKHPQTHQHTPGLPDHTPPPLQAIRAITSLSDVPNVPS